MQACSRNLSQTRVAHAVCVKPIVPVNTLRAALGAFKAERPHAVRVVRRPVVVAATAAPVLAADVEVSVEQPTGTREGICHMNYQRGAVSKVRRILDVLRGRSYEEALILCEYMPYVACEKIIKCLMSAAANAKNNQGAQKTKLFVAECYANGGPQIKRMRPRAQGRGFKIIKGTFHLTIRVEERA